MAPPSSTASPLRREREADAMHGHGDKPFLCPYEHCDRAVAGNGFPRHWNLRDHMKRVHNVPGPSGSTPTKMHAQTYNRHNASVYDQSLVQKLSRSSSQAPKAVPPFVNTHSPTPTLPSSSNEVLSQRLQSASRRYLSANTDTSYARSNSDLSPFRQGSPLAPSMHAFGQQAKKAEHDTRILLPGQTSQTLLDSRESMTILPKDIDLVYVSDGAAAPLFPTSPVNPEWQYPIDSSPHNTLKNTEEREE